MSSKRIFERSRTELEWCEVTVGRLCQSNFALNIHCKLHAVVFTSF